ncbi:MAG: hypothetical protein HYS87_00845 [Candidatus Colwellbacteria bacterium]|nr:hypothetical protein [Candidatus Colwellbacteria bacterium]
MALVQMDFTNEELVPLIIKKLQREKKQQFATRKSRRSGAQLVDIRDILVSAETLAEGLKNAGYELTDAHYEPRQDQRNQNRTYHMVRFWFTRSEHAKPSTDFLSVREGVLSELERMLTTNFWKQLRVYRNPFYSPETGEEVEEARTMSVNLGVPERIFDEKNVRREVWVRDQNGLKTHKTAISHDLSIYADKTAIHAVGPS